MIMSCKLHKCQTTAARKQADRPPRQLWKFWCSQIQHENRRRVIYDARAPNFEWPKWDSQTFTSCVWRISPPAVRAPVSRCRPHHACRSHRITACPADSDAIIVIPFICANEKGSLEWISSNSKISSVGGALDSGAYR